MTFRPKPHKSCWLCRIYILAIIGLVWAPTVLAVPPERASETVNDAFVYESCGNFDVVIELTLDIRYTTFFDKAHNIVRINQFVKVRNATYSNSENPDYSLPGIPGAVEIDHIDEVRGTFTVTGVPWMVVVPGYGAIFHQSGRTIFDLDTFDILFDAGPSDFENGDVGALCAALTP